MKFTGRDGVLRIYDSTILLHGAGIYSGLTIDAVKFDGVATWTNITTDVETDDANFASAFLVENTGKVYVGSTQKFAMLRFLKGDGVNYAVGSGALIVKYYNGTDFSTAVSGAIDGTASGGDCFAADGYIGFQIPPDWAIGANSFNASLDADKYYVELAVTTSPSTDPDADLLCPVDGQYFEVAFAAMDFSGPLGRPKTEETLVLDRKKISARMHYIAGPQDKIYAPLEISFSALIDDTYNKDDIEQALQCGNPGSTFWTATGVTAKGTTKNDGSNANPAFKDSTKKAVNVQIRFAGVARNEGRAFYEVFFPPGEQLYTEGEDGVSLACKGGVFGLIERLHDFGVRY